MDQLGNQQDKRVKSLQGSLLFLLLASGSVTGHASYDSLHHKQTSLRAVKKRRVRHPTSMYIMIDELEIRDAHGSQYEEAHRQSTWNRSLLPPIRCGGCAFDAFRHRPDLASREIAFLGARGSCPPGLHGT